MKSAMNADADGRNGEAEIRPFRIAVPQAAIEDLKDRLARTRWPDELPGVGWKRGVPVDYLKKLADHWRLQYDWRLHEARLNALPQFVTQLEGLDIHFLHIRSKEPNATPLMLVHGWPGSVVEFLEVIEPLTNPRAHGGESKDAFHLVIPSIPGFGFSSAPKTAGWTYSRVAKVFTQLMERLGYTRYGVQGGDIGGFIAPLMGRVDPERVLGVHCNAFVTFPSQNPQEMAELTEAEKKRLGLFKNFQEDLFGYAQIQGTRPQTVSYGLTDSPTAQLAWIVEKFKDWTDPTKELPEEAVNLDQLLTNVSLYWFTGTARSSANWYYETFHDASGWAPKPRSTVPTGIAVFPQDVAIRRFADLTDTVVHWSEFDRGGHFAAMEAPDLLVGDVRKFFRSLS